MTRSGRHVLLALMLLSSYRVFGLEHLPDSEYWALYDLYNTTRGAKWQWFTNIGAGNPWEFATYQNPCTSHWQGVTCITKTSPPPSTYHISSLTLYDRNLRGSIPNSIGNLSYLTSLELDHNYITGPIPEYFGNLKNLDFIQLDHNLLTGQIPASMGYFPRLHSLNLEHNALSGPIPETFGLLTNMGYFNMYMNKLSGTLPNSLSNLNLTAVFQVFENSLTGTIPAGFGNFSLVTDITMYGNKLEGALPEAIGELSLLMFLQTDHNYLTGTIPVSLGALSALEQLSLESNGFTGTLAPELGALRELWYFEVNDNYLTGTVPTSFRAMGMLQLFDVSDNMLTGPLVSCKHWSLINSYAVQNNHFTGSLDGIFGPFLRNDDELGLGLYSIQLDGNQLTGELPGTIFQLPQLKALTIVGSCFHGSLPAALCNATGLEALVLDGLQTGSSCAGTSGRLFTSPLPTCVLSFPALNTLKLSGNRLTGTFPATLNLSHNMLDLDLSRNQLTGSIPVYVQNHSWYNLDLSYNKLSGVLNPAFLVSEEGALDAHFTYGGVTYNITQAPSSRALSLAGNRLSGPVPSPLLPVLNISVLAGNLFECRYDKSDLPQHDQVINTYDCASNSFNIPYYIWLGMAVCGCILVACLWRWHEQLCSSLVVTWKLVTLWCSAGSGTASQKELSYERLPHFKSYTASLQSVQRCAVLCTVFALVVLVPFYTTVSHYYGTHTHQYAYSVSGMYLSGAVPFALSFVFLAALMAVVIASFRMAGVGVHSAIYVMSERSFYQRTAVVLLCLLLNIMVVLGVNIVFVYIALYESSQLLTLAQILLSTFKSAWNLVCAPYIVRKLARFVTKDDENCDNNKRLLDSFFRLQLAVALFNNIAIPCLVVSGIDNNCFSNILLPPPIINVHYVIPKCIDSTINGGCTEFAPSSVASTQFTPPFTYSYQCSSSFITYYAPTFVYMALTSTVVFPAFQCALCYLRTVTVPGSWAERAILYALPALLKIKPNSAASAPQRNLMKPLFPAELNLVNLLTHLGILLTFGAIFPPIAAAMCVSIVALTWYNSVKVGRFLLNAAEAQQPAYVDIINAECEGVGSSEQLQQAVLILVCCSCAFYTLFLFDTLGDAVGVDASVWVLIVVPLAPAVCYFSGDLYSLWQKRYLIAAKTRSTKQASLPAHNEGESGTEVVEVEMVSMKETQEGSGFVDVYRSTRDSTVAVEVLNPLSVTKLSAQDKC